MDAVAGEEVGKGAKFLIQVLTQGVEFGLGSSSGGLLICCRVPRVPGRSKMWVSAFAPNVIKCSKSKSNLLFVDSLDLVNILQSGPGLFQFQGSVQIGGRV